MWFKYRLVSSLLALAIAIVLISPGSISGFTSADYKAVPPFLSQGVPPNVLVIVDNSNSMDEDVDGSAVGSAAANSRSEIARQAVMQALVNANAGRMRLGLMAYQQSGVSRYYVHDSFYYCSYNPATYPFPPSTPKDPATNTLRFPNPVNAGHYIYYDQALPFYDTSNQGNGYCYSQNYHDTGGNNSYWCYSQKTGDLDPPPTVDSPPPGVSEPTLRSTYGYASYKFGATFGPTDEDYAAGFTHFGRQLSWVYVSPTWFSNSSPGKGYLHVPCADSSTTTINAHDTALTNKLGTSNFSTTAADHPNSNLDTPLRNAGLTPLAGTLASARLYFQGTLAAAQGGPQASPLHPPDDYCQKNFIVLVTDGLPSVSQSGVAGDADSLLPDVEAQVELLRSTAVPGFADPFDIQTFVIGFAIPSGLGSKLDNIAAKGSSDPDDPDNPDKFGKPYLANNATELAETLEKIFKKILERMSSSTAASVISSSRSGDGAIYQAAFFPSEIDGEKRQIKWGGDVQSLWVDKYGNMREDCGPATCGDPCAASCSPDHVLNMTADNIVEFYTDTSGVARAKRYHDGDGDGKVVAADLVGDEVSLRDVRFIWSAGTWLAGLTGPEAISQRVYDTNYNNRYIFTWFGDNTNGGPVTFTPADLQTAKPTNYHAYLKAANTTEANTIINYIRGQDQMGYRPRQIDWNNDSVVETYRLGDIIHSTPTVVSSPAEDYDVIYNDPSYQAFRKKYINRRSMVYAGGNDGMLHAFNGGYYDRAHTQFLTAPDPLHQTNYELGAEMWAFIPYNLLPHLKWLTDPEYFDNINNHVYYVDLKPKIFDAKIFDPNDGVHIGGWGTVLVGGMGFGGGQIGIDTDLDGTDDTTLQSAYFILDITNPECPPVILGEYTFPGLGFTTSYPAAIPMLKCDRKDSCTTDCCGSSWPMDWYLALGSGPYPAQSTALNATSSQNANLYLLKLGETASPVYTMGNSGSCPAVTSYNRPVLATLTTNPMILAQGNSFISDISTVDFDLSFQADAVYFGSVDGATGQSGAINRIKVDNDYLDPNNWGIATLLDVNKPVVSQPAVASDGQDYWVYFGTGRFFFFTIDETDNDDKTDLTQQSFYGIKEPRDSNHELTFGTYNNESDLLNVSNAAVKNKNDVSGVAADATTFPTLISKIEGKPGWRLDFSIPGERNLGQATVLGEVLGFTTYVPSTDPCTPEGDSFLYALYYRTGTSYYQSIFGLDSNDFVLNKKSLGRGLTLSPNIHTGANDTTKSFIQTSTGAIVGQQETNPGVIKSGPTSWREIGTDN